MHLKKFILGQLSCLRCLFLNASHLQQGLATCNKLRVRTTWLQSDVGWVTSVMHQWQGVSPYAIWGLAAGSCTLAPAISPGLLSLLSTPPLPLHSAVAQAQLEASLSQNNFPLAGSCASAAAWGWGQRINGNVDTVYRCLTLAQLLNR